MRQILDEARLLKYLPNRPEGECWLWEGTINKSGYGVIGTRVDGKYKQHRAHRAAYEVWVGPIPDGLVLDHVKERGCTNKHCCNPAHLEPVTDTVNLKRGDGAFVINSRKTHCVRGHEFDIERRVGDKVYRDCSKCRLERQRKSDGYQGVGSGRRGARRNADGTFAS